MGENARLVQDSDERLWKNFLRKLRNLIRRRKIQFIPLEFKVDLDENGNHLIEVYMEIEGERIRVHNIEEMWQHGYSIIRNNRVYFVSNNDLKILLSIRSLNPRITEDGRIVSEVYPLVLNYLRRKSQVKESENSKKLVVHEKPPRRLAEVNYDSNTGLDVKMGYELPGFDGLVPKSALKTTPDGEYIRVGYDFYPYPKEEDPKVKEWIEAEHLHVDIDRIPEFFKRDLVLIKSHFKAILSEEVEKLKIIEDNFLPRFSIDTGEKGWLDFLVQYQVGKYVLPHNLFNKSMNNYLRLNETTWIKIDKSKVKEVEKQLEELGAIQTDEGFRLFITKFPSLEEFINQIGGIREVSTEYQRFLDEITDFHYNEEYRLPQQIEGEVLSGGIMLRGYQRAGIHWLNWLTTHYLHGILADDMGLGKTIQMIISMRFTYETSAEKSHSLIICPRSVVKHWYREIKRVFPNAHVYEYHGPNRGYHVFEQKGPYIIITTYDTVSNDIDILKNIPFLFVVLDEGTRIKNPQTKRAKAVKQLNSVHRFVLTGTPIENRPVELWSAFDFLMRGHLGTYGGFLSKFERPIIEGDESAAEFLSKRIRPFILRRKKEQVARDLPEKIEMDEWCELTEEQKSLYGQLQDMWVSPLREALLKGKYVNYATSILPIITKLKQVCDHPALITGEKEPLLGRSEKFDLVVDKLQQIVEDDESVVLFSHFLGTLDLFETFLQREGIGYIRIDGSTRDRQSLIDKFNERKVPVALCSILAAGHGINLIAANHVVHVDRWWNPAIEDQATDRVHRIGQVKTVYVYKILTEGTLEEKIDLLIEKKRGISDKVIGAATREELKWTREELLKILEPISI